MILLMSVSVYVDRCSGLFFGIRSVYIGVLMYMMSDMSISVDYLCCDSSGMCVGILRENLVVVILGFGVVVFEGE